MPLMVSGMVFMVSRYGSDGFKIGMALMVPNTVLIVLKFYRKKTFSTKFENLTVSV